MEADKNECFSLVAQELEVLEAIYPECLSGNIPDPTLALRMEVSIEWDEPRQIRLACADSTSCTSTVQETTLSLSLLPPILLHVVLPSDYPLSSPPKIISLRATHSWFPHLVELQDALLNMWTPGEGVLEPWVDFIKSGRFLNSLGIVFSDHVEIPCPAPTKLAELLFSYQSSAQASQFNQNTYSCAVCLSSMKGSKCLQLSCSHIFCRSCLEGFWKLCILEGDVGRVGCPDPECVKSGREASEEEVARIVTEGEVHRWRWLREKRMLDKDPTIIHCPISFCQTPVHKPPTDKSDEDSGWDKLRTCPSCDFSFCAFCKRTWHGPKSACPISVSEKIVLKYIKAEVGSHERAFIERMYGKSTIARLVAAHEEEKANKKWLEMSTMACPGCNVNVEKSLGCNHMTCAKCHQHFCYRCGTRLNSQNPYPHFSTPGLPCFNKLFDFIKPEDNEWQPVEGFQWI
ncbi:hypothetical protein FISHEDRAFT_34477 [Fistulina hepatica ATCC 64428]|uniref:RBR-type E3 ubiquitin transferase n=1 Tax=Fistulina hepatica ATCC 64428 TaxID=1128425 RepID=A0A0D7ALZ7_9AGAR|nr:hypothetical protein FISHEDRAFT_34477 [Fistulina hepatica ATCC 64428]